MKQYFQGSVRINGVGMSFEEPLEEFEENSGIEIYFDENGEVDDFTMSEIEDYVLDRLNVDNDEDDIISFTGFKVLEEGDEELMSTYME